MRGGGVAGYTSAGYTAAELRDARDSLRQYEWVLMHMAMHDVFGMMNYAQEILDSLSEK